MTEIMRKVVVQRWCIPMGVVHRECVVAQQVHRLECNNFILLWLDPVGCPRLIRVPPTSLILHF